MRQLLSVLAVPLMLGHSGTTAPPSSPTSAVIVANDNRTPAGVLRNGVLTLTLEARSGQWYPEGPNGAALDVAAWAEPGKPLQAPGPLIRVPRGTDIRLILRNTLERQITVFGVGANRGLGGDSLVIPAGASRNARFVASTAGTFYYIARGAPGVFGTRRPEDSQLHGAIIVDSAPPRRGDDERVFVMSWWFTIDTTSPSGLGQATMAINGLSWPHTERLDLVQGDSVRWHVLNLTESDHPMHLHGFYFRMESKGDGRGDTVYAPPQRRLAVTEIINPFQTMTLAWLPSRPGNWIYHCHFAGHVSHHAALDTKRDEFAESMLTHHMSDRPHQMFGLVLGIRVKPHGPQLAGGTVSRRLRLELREKPGGYGRYSRYAFVLGGTPEANDPSAMPLPGPTLVLRRDERVAITLVNRTADRAAVHWHGIELESFPDGVPDWSGSGTEILPSVAPGDSITVRFTPPRAGTFMYHSHFNEFNQINGGLYGAIVVLDPGQTYDPQTDRVMLFSSAGPTRNVIAGPWPPTLLNGETRPDSLVLKAGTTYRFRLINITSDVNTIVRLSDGETPVVWRAVAKDGATLPGSQATMRPASLFFDPGEIYDFEFTPTKPQALTLLFGPPPAPPEFGLPKAATMTVSVKP